MKVIIVGGGIGGLGAGLALARAGHEVEVLEQASAIREVGAGVQISPNGMRVLEWLGLSEAMDEVCFEPEAISLRMGRSGRQIFRLPMAETARKRWGASFTQIHRADLQEILRAACVSTGVAIRTGMRVTGYVRERGGAAVYLEREGRSFGDLIIGADGIHSVIRAQMLGADRARFTGNVAWRVTVPLEALDNPPPPEGVVWAGRKRHAVTTRIRGGHLVNFVGIVEQDDWQEEGWTLEGSRDDLARDFEGWHDSIAEIIAQTETPYRWALHDRPPLATWQDGPVTLLGDAAHPMLPSMAQGAVQALEDAAVLTGCLSEGSIEDALARYFDLRHARVSRIQARSRRNLRLFHRANGFSYLPLWLAGITVPGLMQRPQDWIYSYDALSA